MRILVREDISELFLREDIKFGAVIDSYFKVHIDNFIKRQNEYLDNVIINEAIDIINNDSLTKQTEVFTFKGKYPEQDILNLIMSKRDVTLIPSKYAENGFDFNTDCKGYTCIHYMTAFKPWKITNNCTSFKIWNEYYDEIMKVI